MRSLRARLTLGVTAVLAGVLVLAGTLAARDVDRSEREALDDRLIRTAELSGATALEAVQEELPRADDRLDAVLSATRTSLRLVLDEATASATRGGRDLGLTRRELELLALFMRRPGEILSRRQMHEEVWGYTFDPGTNVADVFVGYLRRKLEAGDEPRILHTVRGVGFVLQP